MYIYAYIHIYKNVVDLHMQLHTEKTTGKVLFPTTATLLH